jgi:transposase
MRRHQWHLTTEQRNNLNQYLSDYPMLQVMYEVKQEFIRYLLLRALNERSAARKLPGFLELIEQLRASPLNSLARPLTSWLEPIVAMWRFTKSNGITEGVHNKMEMISRRAYGFRIFKTTG